MAKKNLSDFEKLRKVLEEMGVPLCNESGSTLGMKSFTEQFARANVPGFDQHADEQDGRKFVWVPGDHFLFDADGNFIAVEDMTSSTVFPKK